jgi:hypothetical protein
MIKPPPPTFADQAEHLELTIRDIRGRRLTPPERARLQHLEQMRSIDARIDDLYRRLTRLNEGN